MPTKTPFVSSIEFPCWWSVLAMGQAACLEGETVPGEAEQVCLMESPYVPNLECPLDECLGSCATEAELRACCLGTHGLPLDEGGALCVAQAAGMPVGIDECKVRFEEPYWIVDTILRDECTTPKHREGWRYYIEASEGAVYRVTYVVYSTLGSCVSP